MSGAALAQVPTPATQAFERLKTLQGDWQGAFPDGRRHTVNYRLSAAGTVLVETWQLGPGRESMTLYHLDGDRLLATHYCPQGNQPRLQWVPGPDPDVQRFDFVDGTGLDLPDRSHQHAFVTRIGEGTYSRSETYVGNQATADERAEAAAAAGAEAAIVYTRIESPAVDRPRGRRRSGRCGCRGASSATGCCVTSAMA